MHLLNIYSDMQHTAIIWLSRNIARLPPVSELIAIQSGLTVTMSCCDCLIIYVFTDLLSAVQNTTNIFRHSSQGVSLDICCKLSQ